MENLDNKTIDFKKIMNLKYGENPHQEASLYSYDKEISWELLQGKFLSYNDIADSSLALEICAEFFDVPCITMVKNSTPCAVALASDLDGCFDKAFDADPVSPFESIVAFTREVSLSLAKKLYQIPFKIIIAPNFEKEALELLTSKTTAKLIKINTPYQEILNFNLEEVKFTPFGALIQDKNQKSLDVNTFKVVTKKKPEQAQAEDMIFAFKVVKHVKSGAIVVVKDLRTIGISASEVNKAQNIEMALAKVCDSPKDSVIASDSALNSLECVQILAQNRVIGAIQPFGSTKDREIVELADKYEISMISTGIRHLKN